MGKRTHNEIHVKHVCPIYFSSETHTDDIQDVDSRQTCTVWAHQEKPPLLIRGNLGKFGKLDPIFDFPKYHSPL
jgi:hypothetical protein